MKNKVTIALSVILLISLTLGGQSLSGNNSNLTTESAKATENISYQQYSGQADSTNDSESTLADLIKIAKKEFTQVSIILNISDNTELQKPISDFNISLNDLSLILSIPASKLIESLSLPENTNRNLSIEDLDIGLKEIDQAYTVFREQIWEYSWNIVLVGMLVIFSSLALTGFFVGQLSNIGSYKKPGKGRADQTTNNTAKDHHDRIIAAIATVHLHIKEAKESENLIIAWNREPASVWKASGKMLMPNQVLETLK